MKLCVTELDFSEQFFCPINGENGPKMGQKQGYPNLLKNLGISFFSAKVPYFRKMFLEIWAKILLTNQIAGF